MHKTKRYNFIYVVIIAMLIMAPVTFSRYTNGATANLKTSIAKWKISINDEPITENTTLNNKIELVYDNQENGIILPGETGHFDMVLDPTGTEVSVQYTINIDLSNMPNDIILTGYKLNSGEMKSVPSDKTLSGEIRLTNQQKLDDSSKKVYRVYWKWTGSSSTVASENYFVNANVKISQIID